MEDTKYLPYSDNNQGDYQANALYSEQKAFYNSTTSGIDTTSSPFIKILYDSTPQARPLEVGSPGNPWQPYDQDLKFSGHTMKYDYFVGGPQIKKWEVSSSGDCYVPNGNSYAQGEIMITQSTDPAGHIKKVYKDVLGRSVCSEDGAGKTYYVYDKKGLLRWIITPIALNTYGNYSGTYTIHSSYKTGMCYNYMYDNKNRLVNKKIPGADSIIFVYDKLDRLVLVQDGNQRLKSPKEWTFIKYDKLGRPIITGTYLKNDTRVALQGSANTATLAYESPNLSSKMYSSNNAFPIDADTGKYLTVTFFDNYWFIPSDTTFNYKQLDGEFDKRYSKGTRGKVTGSKTRTLTSDFPVANSWMLSVNYYEKYGRAIQVITKNHQGAQLVNANKYNFAGELIKSKERIIKASWSVNNCITRRYVYDHRSRPLELWHQVNKQDSVLLSHWSYNTLGQLAEKNLHGKKALGYIQSIDYTYNVLGMLKKINNISDLSVEVDAFGLELVYNDSIPGLTNSFRQYNGNIAAAMWKFSDETSSKAYAYTYDALDRLTQAKYFENAGSSWNAIANKYNVRGITYDSHGNIQTMNCDGNSGKIDSLFYSYNSYTNQLKCVDDKTGGTSEPKGFSDGLTSGITSEYSYDANGNMVQDLNKSFAIVYNSLNLPRFISPRDTTNLGVEFVYSATGERLVKAKYNAGKTLVNSATFHYMGSFVFDNTGVLAYILTEEGRILKSGSNYIYEYNLTDQLGNTRAVIQANSNGSYSLKQKSDYYPFGKRHEPISPENDNKYLYNSKELEDDLINGRKLDWYFYGARFYDPQIGRWHALDPLMEQYSSLSPYNYVGNNPINRIDPDGMRMEAQALEPYYKPPATWAETQFWDRQAEWKYWNSPEGRSSVGRDCGWGYHEENGEIRDGWGNLIEAGDRAFIDGKFYVIEWHYRAKEKVFRDAETKYVHHTMMDCEWYPTYTEVKPSKQGDRGHRPAGQGGGTESGFFSDGVWTFGVSGTAAFSIVGATIQIGAVVDFKDGATKSIRPYITVGRSSGFDFSAGLAVSYNKPNGYSDPLDIYSIESWGSSFNGGGLVFDGGKGGDQYYKGFSLNSTTDSHSNYVSYNGGLSLGSPIAATASKTYTWVFW